MDDILMTRETAGYLKAGEAYIRRLIRLKKLRAYGQGRYGGYNTVESSQIEAWGSFLEANYFRNYLYPRRKRALACPIRQGTGSSLGNLRKRLKEDINKCIKQNLTG